MPPLLLSHSLMGFFSVLFPPDHSTGHWHRSRSQHFTDSLLPHLHSTVQSRSYNPPHCTVHTRNATDNIVTRSTPCSLLLSTCLHLTFKNRASYVYDGHTATLQMFHFIYIFSTNINTEDFKHATHSQFFSSKCRLFRNATFFGSRIINILHTGCAKI